MDNNGNSRGSGFRGRGRGRFNRYRPYTWRGRGRGSGGVAAGRNSNSDPRHQHLMMPPPIPYSRNDRSNRNVGDSESFDSQRVPFDHEQTLDFINHHPPRRQQQRLDDVVLSRLAQTYPGYSLYFSTALSSIEKLLDKIAVTMQYFHRHQLIPNLKEALAFESKEYFDITYDTIIEDKDFERDWSTFDADLLDYPEDVLNVWGISAHTIVHRILTEHEDLDKTDLEDSVPAVTTNKSKVNVPYIQARVMKSSPITPIKSIKAILLGKFVVIRGTVVRTGTVKPHCSHMTFKCSDCFKKFVLEQPDGRFFVPKKCRTIDCSGKVFEALEIAKSTQFTTSMKIRIQDAQHPDSERGTVPRSIDCVLGNNLHNVCNAGDAVTICGVVKFHREGGGIGVADQQLHQFYIDVVAVRNHKDSERTMGGNLFTFSNKDYYAVKDIHDSDNLFRLLVASICPTIFGHELVKAGLLLCLFGGTPPAKVATISRRSDINVLIVGDPGLGKSQMLSIVSEVAPRGVYVCGTATTVAGLTVTLVKDGDDYSLEAGALVMADRGVCCIDEFDKMQAQHHALLEAMEQQSISIAKSGVFRTLPARTSVIAAANPVGGHYDPRKSVPENIRINPALLSRFDLTFLLVDRSDEETDRNIVNHILGMRVPKQGQSLSQIPSSLRSSGLDSANLPLKEKLKFMPNDEVDLIPHPLIRKYIAYARQYVYPTLSPEAAALIKDYYLRLRVNHKAVDATPVTPRQLESLLRLTQARAKLELREVATEEDARDILEIFDFGMTGIFEDDIALGTPFSYLPGSKIAPSRSQTKGTAKKLLATLQRFAIQENKKIFNIDEIKQIGRAIGIGSGFDTLVTVLNTEGFLINKGGRVYQLQSVDF